MAILELKPDPASGKRRQRQGGSYKFKREAQEALAEMVTGQWVAPAQLTLADTDLLAAGLSTTSVQTIGKVLRMSLGDAVK